MSTEAKPDEVIAIQRKAIDSLKILDGLRRGRAKVLRPGGKEMELTQTERSDTLLGGAIRLIEGRGYAADGTIQFNAFAVISYSPQTQKYNFRSYAQGHEGDFPIEVRADGFTWPIKAGLASIRYSSTVKDDVWTEIGERIVEGRPPVRTFEMTLHRIGTTNWPHEGAAAPN